MSRCRSIRPRCWAAASPPGSARWCARQPSGPGDSVLVIGCGGVGLAAIQAARLSGAARIIAADRVAAQLPAAVANGATHTVDASDVDLAAAVRDLTGGAEVARSRR